MFTLIIWAVYGLVIGLISKWLHPGDEPQGFLPTVSIGIGGMFVGGFINYLMGNGSLFAPSGVAMGVVGGVICCYLYAQYRLTQSKGNKDAEK